MKPLDRKTLKAFVKLALERLKGDWVVVGGTVLPLLDVEFRSTTDIDFVGLSSPDQAQTLALMEISESLGLPVETVNQAAAYFLFKIPSYKKGLILFTKSANVRIYRPNLVLFIRLKISRMAESDLLDCIEFIRFCRNNEELPTRTELKKIISIIEKEKKSCQFKEKLDRLEQLFNALAQL